jgi:ribosomal protein L29
MSDRLTLANAIEEALVSVAGHGTVAVDTSIVRAKAERIASTIVDLIHDNVATKVDIAELRAATKADIAELRAVTKAEIAELRAVTKADIAELRGETRQVRTDLTARIELVEHRLFTRLGSLAVVLSGLIVAAMHWWPPHAP